jgi:hypothetical protein
VQAGAATALSATEAQWLQQQTGGWRMQLLLLFKQQDCCVFIDLVRYFMQLES